MIQGNSRIGRIHQEYTWNPAEIEMKSTGSCNAQELTQAKQPSITANKNIQNQKQNWATKYGWEFLN